MTDEPRLYSRQERVPADVVATQHRELHGNLEAWGRWCREAYQAKTCDSIEGDFEGGAGGREAKAPQITLPENPLHRQIDRVVRHMRMHMNKHGEGIKMYYVGILPNERRRRQRRNTFNALRYEPCSPTTICVVLHLRFEEFPDFMLYARAAVLNLLRRQGDK